MREVVELACVTGGQPVLDGRSWFAAVAGSIDRLDPFTRRRVSMPTWLADRASPSEETLKPAEVVERIRLEEDVAWSGLRSRGAVLHDGHLFELWVLLLGFEAAKPLWRPTWVSDSDEYIFRFPQLVTTALARIPRSELLAFAARWAEQPYMAREVSPLREDVVAVATDIVVRLASRAFRTDSDLVAVTSAKDVPA